MGKNNLQNMRYEDRKTIGKENCMIKNNLHGLRYTGGKTIGEKITQEKLAEILGIEKTTYRKYEDNKVQLPLKHAVTLAQKLGWSLDSIYQISASKSDNDIPERKTKFDVDIRDIISFKDGKVIIKMGEWLWQYFSAINTINARGDTAAAKKEAILNENINFEISDNNIARKIEIAVNMDDFISFYNADGQEIPAYFEDNKGKQKEPTKKQLKEATRFFKRLFEGKIILERPEPENSKAIND